MDPFGSPRDLPFLLPLRLLGGNVPRNEAICKDGSFGHPGVLKFCIFQPSPASKFIQGYLGAVISAVSIAVSSSHPPPSATCCSVAVPPASQARHCLGVRAGQAVWEAEVSV